MGLVRRSVGCRGCGRQTACRPGTARDLCPANPGGGPDFQPHHQPFNYYANFDPATQSAQRAAHLKDYGDLLADIAAGRLPPVVFYKPQGNLNQHPGYASIADGDTHIAELVAALRAGPQWNHMVIVITYDEYGGAWDHLAPPRGDLLGPGTRIPALIVSPFARYGTVDHTKYDTASILRLIIRRFDLAGLPGIALRDQALEEERRTADGRPHERTRSAALTSSSLTSRSYCVVSGTEAAVSRPRRRGRCHFRAAGPGGGAPPPLRR